MLAITRFSTFLLLLSLTGALFGYPIDGYYYTGIDRLAYQYKTYKDSTQVSKLKPGSFLMLNDISLNLLEAPKSWPDEDETLQSKVDGIFRYLEPQYSVSIMDISDPENILYAGRKEEVGYQPGSVGKLAVAAGFFTALHSVYGDNWEHIRGILFTKKVKAGQWVIHDHHTIPLYDIAKDKLTNRQAIPSDVFSVYEWIDHMFSKSSNAAASIIMRETILIYALDVYYECATMEEMHDFFQKTPKAILADLSEDLMNCPLRDLGISADEFRLGGFFTDQAEQYVPRQGGSIGTTKGLMKFLFALESGQIVNPTFSLEIKRLLYMTDRRIRYASSPAIAADAVYFKSGSLYSFYDEPGFVKRQYAGNRYNYMNSIAIVEKQDSTNHKYMVALMSNVLRKNSVAEHTGLATQIDRLMR